MKNKKLEKIIREAFRAGHIRGEHDANNNYFDAPLTEDEYVEEFFKKDIIEGKKIPITLASIKAICGWSKYCDVTGSNHYMLNEHSVEDSEIFHVKETHVKTLNLIK